MPEAEGIALLDGENIADVSPWEFDSVVEEAGNEISLVSPGIHGNGKYKISFGGINDAVYGVLAIGDQTDYYARQYVTIDSWTRVGEGANYIQLGFSHDGSSIVLYLTLYLLAGDSDIGAVFGIKHGGGWNYIWDDSEVATFSVGTAFWVEAHYKVGEIGTGGGSVWAKGVLKGSDYTTYDTSTILPDNLWAGVIKSSPVPSAETIVHIDDSKIDTVPIGNYCDLRRRLWSMTYMRPYL